MTQTAAPRILWNLFHESLATSRGNRALLDAVADLPGVTVNDLYARYPDFAIDVAHEQALLREHDVIVMQHPFYWYSTPALMKQWQDKVLTFGFAYPPNLGKELHGKTWWSVLTTGGPEWSYRSGGYNNFSMSELLRPLQQTAYLCGMQWRSPFVVHGVLPGDMERIRATTQDELQTRAAQLRAEVQALDPAERHSLAPVVTPWSMT